MVCQHKLTLAPSRGPRLLAAPIFEPLLSVQHCIMHFTCLITFNPYHNLIVTVRKIASQRVICQISLAELDIRYLAHCNTILIALHPKRLFKFTSFLTVRKRIERDLPETTSTAKWQRQNQSCLSKEPTWPWTLNWASVWACQAISDYTHNGVPRQGLEVIIREPWR